MLIIKRVAACMLTALLLLSAVPVSTMASEGTTDVGIAEAGYHDILLETAPIFGTVAENAREPVLDADTGATIGATNDEYFSGAGEGTGVLFSWEEASDDPSAASAEQTAAEQTAAGQTAAQTAGDNLSSGENENGEAAYADPAGEETYSDQAGAAYADPASYESYEDQAPDTNINHTDETFADQVSDTYTDQTEDIFTDQTEDIFTDQTEDTFTDQTSDIYADQIIETYSGRTEETFADQVEGEGTSLDQLPADEMTVQTDYDDPASDELLTDEVEDQTAYEDSASDEFLTDEVTDQAAYNDPASDEHLTDEVADQAAYEDPASDETLTDEVTDQAAYEDPASKEILTDEVNDQTVYEDSASGETLTDQTAARTDYEAPAEAQVPSGMDAEDKRPAEEWADPAGSVYNNASDDLIGGEIDELVAEEEESASPALGASDVLPGDASEGDSSEGNAVQTQTDPDSQKTGETETDENGKETDGTDSSVPASVDERAVLMGMSLSLTDQIVMNIYVRTDNSVEDDDYIEFDCAGNTVRQMVSDAGASQMTMADGETIDVLIFEMPLRLRQMTDDVTFHMVVDHEAGRSITRTVRTYADQILAGSFPEEQKNITRAMLNCGSYVQEYFGYNTDRPANDGIFAEGSNPVSDWEDPDMSSFEYSLQQSDSSQAFRFFETTLELKEDVSLICYYAMDYDWIDIFSDYSFKLNNSDKELEVGYDRDKGMYYVKVSHIMPYELDQMFEVVVEKKLLWFGSQTVAVLKYSPLSYCREMLQSPDSSDSIRNLCKSLYYYWQAASTVR